MYINNSSIIPTCSIKCKLNAMSVYNSTSVHDRELYTFSATVNQYKTKKQMKQECFYYEWNREKVYGVTGSELNDSRGFLPINKFLIIEQNRKNIVLLDILASISRK